MNFSNVAGGLQIRKSYTARNWQTKKLNVKYIARGGMTVSFEGVDMRLKTGQVLIYGPGLQVDYVTDKGETHDIFSAGAMDVPERLPPRVFDLDEDMQKIVVLMLDDAYQYDRDAEYSHHLYQVYLFTAYRTYHKKNLATTPSSTDVVAAVDKIIRANLSSSKGVRELIADLPWDYQTAYRYFKREMGYTLKAHQLKLKIDEAKNLLLNTSMSMTDIAFDLGFPSAQHFSKVFKDLSGFSPREYRKSSDEF